MNIFEIINEEYDTFKYINKIGIFQKMLII